MESNRTGKTIVSEQEQLDRQYREYWKSERGQERLSYGHSQSVLALLQRREVSRG